MTVCRIQRSEQGAMKDPVKVPTRASEGANGFDVYARQDWTVGYEPTRVPTGWILEVPSDLDCQVRGRSGLAAKGIIVHQGTIDSDYRGELLILMWTLPHVGEYEIKAGDRIAQLVFTVNPPVLMEPVDRLSVTARGSGGVGSTGQ